MRRAKVFNDNRSIILTPMLSGDNYSSIAYVEVYFNEYGKVVVTATNHDGATGYYAFSLDSILKDFDNDTLKYVYECINNELKER